MEEEEVQFGVGLAQGHNSSPNRAVEPLCAFVYSPRHKCN
jgi:hypothetical protein